VRLLAAADVSCALLSERPQRPAHTRDAAASVLGEEVRAGRLAKDAVAALLAALDGTPAPVRRSWPCGLSEREVQVLRWVAVGKSNLEVGQLLGISAKTVKNHVAHVYARSVCTAEPAPLCSQRNTSSCIAKKQTGPVSSERDPFDTSQAPPRGSPRPCDDY
jgi:regulatory LuxR family protein